MGSRVGSAEVATDLLTDVSLSLGGGRGKYCKADGDVPVAVLQRMKLETSFLADREEQRLTSAVFERPLDKLVVISWNACGMQGGVIDDVADLLDAGSSPWDLLLYQEGPYEEAVTERTLESGHIFSLDRTERNGALVFC